MHDQPVPVPLANISPVGNVSVTVMVPLLAAIPPLVTVRVYCAPCWPCVKPLPTCAFEIVRSGNCPATTVTMSVFEVLLLVLLSVHVHATVAELLNGVAALFATFTFSVMPEVPLAAIGVALSVQVTAWPTAMHDQPVPVPLANVNPAGNVSVTVIVPVVAVPPPLVTVRVYCAP